jgi:Flp pilus assembly protein TadG
VSSERGQILPLFVLLLVPLLGISAMAIDIGYLRYLQNIEQTAADSAAVAGATELNYPAAADWSGAAKADATSNGFTGDGGATVSVTPINPPTTGTYAGNASAVQVTISKKQPFFFAQFLGMTSQWVTVVSVAVVTTVNRNCIVGLSTTATNAITFGGGNISTPNCGIFSNSSISMQGANVTANSIEYVSGTPSIGGANFPEAQPTQAVASLGPCAAISGCAYLQAHPPSPGTCATPSQFNGVSTTIPPGTYCSQLQLNGGANVVFAPGVYLLEAGLQINGVGNLSGTGVTFYITGGQIQFNGATESLAAPTSGNTAGVLFYQAPGDTTAATLSGSNGTFAGLLYFPTADLDLYGGLLSSSTLAAASTITINGGNVSVTSTVTSNPGFGHAVLAQ